MMPWQFIGDTVDGLINLADQAITDKDKLIEYKFKAAELKMQGMQSLLSTTTTPKVDATVKIIFAINTLWRPLLGAVMTAFGAYAHFKGIPMDTAAQVVFDGAFPAWGLSRHVEKKSAPKSRSQEPIFPMKHDEYLHDG